MKKESLQSPQVVATVTQSADLDFLTSGNPPECDILEYRLDNLLNDLGSLPQQLSDAALPTLITARRPDEGGANDLDDQKRVDLYRNFLDQADLLDIEIASLRSNPTFLDLASEAQSKNIQVVASFHDFSGFPGKSELSSIIKDGYHTGANIVKLAVVVNTMPELFHLVELVEENQKEGRLISAMGMGPLGKLSRLVLAKAGSCLN